MGVEFIAGLHGHLHRPDAESRGTLLLTHGASSNCNAPLLVAVAGVFAEGGYTVLRYDLPFRQLRAQGPPRGAIAAQDREGLRKTAGELRRIAPGRLFIGGHSYGGRQASMLAAEEPSVCDGLLLFSYPLHPPGKAEQLRTAHFPNLRIPVLFVHGTRDPFGSIEEMREAHRLIQAPVAMEIVDGAGHDLKRGSGDVAQRAQAAFRTLTGN